jgi:hemerythrin-like domain-containing protein
LAVHIGVPGDPIAQLMQEHNEALVQLKKLNKAVSAISEHGYSATQFRQVSRALEYIAHEVGEHNKKEERALFPVLERYVEGPTKVMRSDHKKLKSGFIQLERAAKALQARRDSFSAVRNLSKVSQSVVQLFVNHIHKENHILFPLIQRFLSKEEIREIARKML